MDSLIHVPEVPWASLGKKLETVPTSTNDIMKELDMSWTVSAHRMSAEDIGEVYGYHTIIRDDNKRILGVVNNAYPKLVQNEKMFGMLDHLMGDDISFECGGELQNGVKVFGCFKLHEKHSILGDECETYMIVLNEHTKCDQKVSIIFTPVRIVCQNMLSYAIGKNSYMCRMPVTDDVTMNRELAYNIIENAQNSITLTNRKAEMLAASKYTSEQFDQYMDDMFPFQKNNTGDVLDTKANESTEILRETFRIDCLQAPNLSDFDGTGYQLYMAMADFEQHYYKSVNSAYDLTKRMMNVPSVLTPSEPSKLAKTMKDIKKYVEFKR